MAFFEQRTNLSDITRLHLRIYQFIVSETIPIAARLHIEQIKQRSASMGFGPPGYTPKYAKRREALGLQTNTVDFRVSGRLLDTSLRKTATGVGVEESVEPIIEGLSGKRPGFWGEDFSDMSEIANELGIRLTNSL